MALRLMYLILLQFVSWAVLLARSEASKDAEILVLRHQLAPGPHRRIHGMSQPQKCRHRTPPTTAWPYMERIPACSSEGILACDFFHGIPRPAARRLLLRQSATGNLATEDLVWMFDGLGIEHGADLGKVAAHQRVDGEGARAAQPVPSCFAVLVGCVPAAAVRERFLAGSREDLLGLVIGGTRLTAGISHGRAAVDRVVADRDRLLGLAGGTDAVEAGELSGSTSSS